MHAASSSPLPTRPAQLRSGAPAPEGGTATRTRLAVLTDAVYPWHTGGKELRQHELFRRLTRRGLDVDVYTMKWWDTPGDLVRDGVTYRAVSPLVPLYAGRRRSVLQAVVFAAASLRVLTRPFDVLEADMVPVIPLFTAKAVTLLRRKPLVVTWHEYWGRAYWVEYLGPLGHVAATLERVAATLPDRIVAASSGTRRRLLEAGCPGTRVVAVPNGIDLAALDGGPAGTPVRADLVTAGRLLSHKNVDVALRALRILHDRGERHTLAVIGDGPEAGRLAALAQELGLGGSVTFTDVLPDQADVFASMAHARALLFPSAREGFGMVALEAMALGTPVITSDAPDNFAQDLVVDGVNGAVVAPEPLALADAVTRVLADEDRLGEGARATARGYDWSALADAAAKVYLP